MEDKEIRDLFETFNPELEPDFSFMSRLEHAMDSVELIREKQAIRRRHQRLAMAIAAAVGVLSGILMSLLFPWLWDSITAVHSNIHHAVACMSEPPLRPIYYCVVIGLISVLTTVSAYDITLALQSRKE